MERVNPDEQRVVRQIVRRMRFTIPAALRIQQELRFEYTSQACRLMIAHAHAPGPGMFICLHDDGIVRRVLSFGGCEGAGLFPPARGSLQTQMGIFRKLVDNRTLSDLCEDSETRIQYRNGW